MKLFAMLINDKGKRVLDYTWAGLFVPFLFLSLQLMLLIRTQQRVSSRFLLPDISQPILQIYRRRCALRDSTPIFHRRRPEDPLVSNFRNVLNLGFQTLPDGIRPPKPPGTHEKSFKGGLVFTAKQPFFEKTLALAS